MLLSSISIDIYISVYFRLACSWLISFHICTKTFLTSDLAQQKSFKVVRNKENVYNHSTKVVWLGEYDSVQSEKEVSILTLASWEVLWKRFVTLWGSEGFGVWGI